MPDAAVKSVDELLEDYATSRVPQHRTVGGVRIGFINGALAFAVPGLVTGLEIGGALGLRNSLAAFLLGGLILSVIGSMTGVVGALNRLTSCMTVTFVFGRRGAALINLAFAASLLGWFGINMDLFSGAIRELSDRWLGYSPDVVSMEVGAGVLMTLTTLWGFRLLEKIASMVVPVMVLVFLYMAYRGLEYETGAATAPPAIDLGFGEAVSAVVGSFIVGAVLMPDFARFAARKRDAVIASVLPFLLLSSFVYIVSAAAGLAVGSTDALVVLLALGMGSLALALVGISSWVTNVANLYSASLGINAVFTTLREWQIVLVAGALGTFAASLNLLENFTGFLFSLSIIFAPVAAIYVTDFFLLRRATPYPIESLESVSAVSWQAMFAWLAGVVVSLLSNSGKMSITSIEACDAMLVAMVAYLALKRLTSRPDVENS